MTGMRAAALGVFLAASSFAATALSAVDAELVARLGEGQKVFESTCGGCHDLERPLSREMSRAEWETLILEMAGKGAEVSPEDRTLIADYLLARLAFSNKCTVCHTRERVLDREGTLAEWQDMVNAMVDKNPKLFTAEEARFILAYLTLVLDPPGAPGD